MAEKEMEIWDLDPTELKTGDVVISTSDYDPAGCHCDVKVKVARGRALELSDAQRVRVERVFGRSGAGRNGDGTWNQPGDGKGCPLCGCYGVGGHGGDCLNQGIEYDENGPLEGQEGRLHCGECGEPIEALPRYSRIQSRDVKYRHLIREGVTDANPEFCAVGRVNGVVDAWSDERARPCRKRYCKSNLQAEREEGEPGHEV